MSIKSLYKIPLLVLFLFALMANEGCVTKKRKKDVTKLSKFYHNVTSEFNGYFNANELVEFAIIDLQEAHDDNYTQIIDVYDFVSVSDPKMVNADMDKAIEKVTRVAALHEPGDWVDDCYVLMGKAQFLKQDYETAVETFEYFQEDFNPANPYGRNFKQNKLSTKASNKERKKARKAAKKEKDRERKRIQEEREKEKAEREKERKRRKKSSSRKSKKTRVKKEVVDTSKVIVEKSVTPKATPVNETEPLAKKTTVKEPKDKTAYNEGLIWLAKSYIRAGKYTSAEFLLNRLEKLPDLDKDLAKEMVVAQADLMIKSGKPYDALNYLDDAIESKSSKRGEEARYAFIAGQILMANGQYNDAVSYFKISKRKSKDYKMKFMSTLNEIKCEQLQGNSNSNFAGKLEKMLKETKYEEFKDEIYFALGEIEATKGNVDGAKEYFALSAANNKGNNSLKTEAYYQLASINYNLERYVDAKAYYDSTLMVIEKADPRRGEVQKYAVSLTDIAKNIETITRLDSVIALASKPEEELMKIALKRLEEEKKTGQKTDTKVGDENLFVKRRKASSASSNFWAYNIISKEVGKTQFINTWGDRPLVDNWRISSKIESIAIEQEEIAVQEEAKDSSTISKEEYERLMADVPKNALAKGKLEEQVRKAMFELGKQYRDKLQKYQKSAETLETLNTRFSNHEDILDAYYYLYLDYQDLNKAELAEKYANLITTNYPDSKYGQLIKNPAFADKLEEEKKKIDRYYDQTYAMFKEGKYEKVAERVAVANQTFGKDNKLIAKFTLLDAMASGYAEGQKAYVKGLNEVIVRFPNTPEELKAKEILRFLKGDKGAFNELDVKVVNEMFEMNDDSRHYVAVILFDYSDDVLQPAKIAISDYNKAFHSKDRLQMGEMLLNKTENTQLVLIRSFPNKAQAMDYYEGVGKNKDRFIPEDVVSYEVLPITQQNYRKMLQQRTHTNYRAYFKSNYLEE